MGGAEGTLEKASDRDDYLSSLWSYKPRRRHDLPTMQVRSQAHAIGGGRLRVLEFRGRGYH